MNTKTSPNVDMLRLQNNSSDNLHATPEFQQYIEAAAVAIIQGETTLADEHNMLLQYCSMYDLNAADIERVLINLNGAYHEAINTASIYLKQYIAVLCSQCYASDSFSDRIEKMIDDAIEQKLFFNKTPEASAAKLSSNGEGIIPISHIPDSKSSTSTIIVFIFLLLFIACCCILPNI